jgi:hypothetical protein
MKKPIPPQIIKQDASNRSIDPFTLLCFFDSIAFTEVRAKNRKQFDTFLAFWKKDTLPTLRQDTRFFIRLGKDKTITEIPRKKL